MPCPLPYCCCHFGCFVGNSLISDDLRKGLTKRAEHTFRVALALALMSGVAIMLLMEVGDNDISTISTRWNHSELGLQVVAVNSTAGTGADPVVGC